VVGIDVDLLSVVRKDHRAVEDVFIGIENASASPDLRRRLLDHVIAELVQHAVAEEQCLYPTVREVLPDGNELAERELAEHAGAESVMKRLDGMPPDDPAFDDLVGTLIEDIRRHMAEEETQLLPRLQSACSSERLRRLGEEMLKVREKAPTRPHPLSSDKPSASRLVAPGLRIVDRVRDVLSGRTE
jgi:hemerythrin superfamily protein